MERTLNLFVAKAAQGLLGLTFLAVIGLSIWYTVEVTQADILPAFRYSRYYQMINVVLMFSSMIAMVVHYKCARQRCK
jgi:hypothetical protein